MEVDLNTRSMVKMDIKGLVVDPVSDVPVVILQRPGAGKFLPIWIGHWEANSIALVLEGVTTPRPMTHDLMANLISSLGRHVGGVYIHTLSENVYHASIKLTNGGDPAGEGLLVDARPSDAISLAIRTGSDIFVSEEVLEAAEKDEPSVEESLRSILEKLSPDDLGEYEM
jgi:hypothetical protein